ncbi:MAG: extracellular solute-binding protein [Treponema sp.]|nr:extracellular solute-binding protein [Treponema sp.]
MKKIVMLAAAGLIAASLFALGGSDEKASSSSGATTITFWAFPTFFQNNGAPAGSYEQEQIRKFEAANPGIKVRLETIDFTSGPDKIVASIEGGTAPDVLFDAPGRIIDYGKQGKLANLNDMFTAAFKSDIGNNALVAACSDGKNYYMYPISASPFYMGINKELWEKVGALKYVNLEGDRTWTTENFIKAMQCFKGTGTPGLSVYCGGQGGDQGTRALVTNLYSARIANQANTKYTIDSPEGIKALKLLKSMVDEGLIDAGMDIAAADELQLFSQQKLASTICWGTSNAKNYATKDFTALSIPFPSDDGVPELEYLVNGFCVFNNNDTAKIEAAKKFIKFLCDDSANVIQTGAFPVKQSMGNLYGQNDAEMNLLARFTKYYGPYYNTMDGFANMRTEWWNMLQFIFSNKKTVEKAAADYVKASNAGM